MIDIVRLCATTAHKQKYRELLLEEWTPETMRRTLALSREFLDSGKQSLGYSGLACHAGFEQWLLSSIKILSLTDNTLPAAPERLPHRKSVDKLEKHRLSTEVAYNLAFPLSVLSNPASSGLRLEGDTEFFRDLQSLVFILVANYLIPDLKKWRMMEERDFLALVLLLHALTAWRDNPAHQHYLFAVLFSNLGWNRLYRLHLYHAFKLTAFDAHDYLSKAQAYWSALLDEGSLDEAENFCLNLLKQSKQEDFPEIKEMIDITFSLKGVGN